MRLVPSPHLISLCAVGALTACAGPSGTDGTTTNEGSCDDIVTAPLGTVSVEDWPQGTADAMETFLSIPGRWEVDNSCGLPTAIKITTGPQETLELVQEPWPLTHDCGCLTDPSFAPDSKYGLVAVHDSFEFFVETFDDPGVSGQTLEGSVTLFAPGEAMRLRGCAVTNIDPLLGSTYEQLTTILRIEQGGIMSSDLVLAKEDGTVQVCTLSNFTLVE
ncbi:MAG TPA: hypothetical protein ENK18_26595 [Deltaproteobacteria bacterium]|nr:hypothetical protein [Deltaproteobacteria bacterium]